MQSKKSIVVILAIILIGAGLFLFIRSNLSVVPTIETDEQKVSSREAQEENTDVIELDQDVMATGAAARSSEESQDEAQESDQQREALGAVESKEIKYIVFYGDTCPHCHDVLDWMEESGIESLLSITTKEVYNNPQNNEQLKLAAQNCGSRSSGVPFLYTSEKECLVGSTPIIDYLSEQAGLN